MTASFLTTLCFAFSAVSASRSARLLGGTTANFSRMWLAALMLGLWAHLFGSGMGGGAFAIFALSGVVGFGLGDIALFGALTRIGPRLTMVLVQCLAAPFGALIEWLWLGTQMTTMEMAGSAIILTGVAIAVAPAGGTREATPRQPALGTAFGVIAALGQAGGAVMSRKAYSVIAAAGDSIDGGTAAYQRMLGGLVVVTLFFLVMWQHGRARENGTPAGSSALKWKRAWGWVVLNAIAGPTVGVGCYQWALATTPSGVVLPIVAATPVVVIPLAWRLEGDRPQFRSLLGGLLAVAGAVVLAMQQQ